MKTIPKEEDRTRLPLGLHGLAGFMKSGYKDAAKQGIEAVTITVTVAGKGFDRAMTENFDFQVEEGRSGNELRLAGTNISLAS